MKRSSKLVTVQFEWANWTEQMNDWTESCPTLRPHGLQHATLPSLSISNSWSLLKLVSIASVMPSNHLILCRPLLPPSIFPSIWVFSSESVLCIRWPKYWSFSFSISPSNEYSGLISFRMDWLDLHAVQGTLKNLLQHHSSKASILQHSAFFILQLSHPYITTGKTIALTRWTFVGNIMSLTFNMLSRLVITFLPKKVKSLSCVQLFATPWTIACQAPLSMESSRQEYWNGLPFPSPGDLPNPGIETGSPTLQADALPSEPPGKPYK